MAGAEYVSIWMRPERVARGRKPVYSRAQITEAAIRIADVEGLEAATMRRIAAEIGAGTMSLYRYVPSRDDLIELMADRLMGEIDIAGLPSGDWRSDLAHYAHQTRAMWLRHPWIATVNRVLPGHGPNQLRLIERVMGALDPHVSIDENLALMAILNSYVEGVVREEVIASAEIRSSGLSEVEFMSRMLPRVQELLASGEYPIFAKIVTEAGQLLLDYDDRFRYGLDRVLDCIAAALPLMAGISSRTGGQDRPSATPPRVLRVVRDETGDQPADRDETARPGACATCGGAVPSAESGRPRLYCSRACQQRAYRNRQQGAAAPR